MLKVVRPIFKETSPVRFEGNNYSAEWVKEAAKRGLLNLRRTPEALAQLMTKQSHKLLTSLGILSETELESRYHVRLERYIKDMLIELHTMREMVDTFVLAGRVPVFRDVGQLRRAGEERGHQGDSADRGGERARRVDRRPSEAAHGARQSDRQGRGDARGHRRSRRSC